MQILKITWAMVLLAVGAAALPAPVNVAADQAPENGQLPARSGPSSPVAKSTEGASSEPGSDVPRYPLKKKPEVKYNIEAMVKAAWPPPPVQCMNCQKEWKTWKSWNTRKIRKGRKDRKMDQNAKTFDRWEDFETHHYYKHPGTPQDVKFLPIPITKPLYTVVSPGESE